MGTYENIEIPVKVNGSIISELSERIPSNIVALNELIKNAYDAGASKVEIIIDTVNNSLNIIDDGEGMNRDDISTLLHLARSTKKYGTVNEKYNRYVQGSKGLGFLSVFKFGREVCWKTKKDIGYEFSVKFDDILSEDDITQYKAQIKVDDTVQKGTDILIKLDDYSKASLINFLSLERNYTKIINSFTDNNFMIILKIDNNEFRSDTFTGIKDHYTDRQLFYIEYHSDKKIVEFYHNRHLIKSYPYDFPGVDYSCDIFLSTYKFKAKQKTNIYHLFYNDFDELTPLIYINNNLFNNYEIFDPSVMKTIKTGDMLNQMIGYINIYSNSTLLQFNSDRTKFAQNSFTDNIIAFLKEINIFIQKTGSSMKQFLVDYNFLLKSEINYTDVNLHDTDSLKQFIDNTFIFKDDVEIKVLPDKIEYSVFGKSTFIMLINMPSTIQPAKIILKENEVAIIIPSNQVDLLDYVSYAQDSNGDDIRDKLSIKIDDTQVGHHILPSITSQCIRSITYSFNDEQTGLIEQKLLLKFVPPISNIVGTFKDEHRLLYVPMNQNYCVDFNNTISNLINQINDLEPYDKYIEVIACSLRVLFEYSIKCINHSNKNLSLKAQLAYNDNVNDIRKIVDFCNLDDNAKKIDCSTRIGYKNLRNMLIVDDFCNAYKKSNLGPHAASAFLTKKDIEFIAQKATIFVVLVNELLTNNNLV